MFNFLKDKLKAAISRVTERTKEEIEKPITIEPATSVTEKITEEKIEKPETTELKKSLFKKIQEKVTLKTIKKEKFEELFSEIEIALLENNVAQEVVERIKKQLAEDLVDNPIKRNEISSIIKKSFKTALDDILGSEKIDLLALIKKKEKKPYIILVIGYNGVGKSITIAKIANYLKNKNLKVILAAGDTFRAAGSSQLAEYAKQIEVPVIKGKLGADSCSIIYDAVNSAKSKEYDVVLGDTAGRLHSNENLLNELKKIVRVNNPDLSILVLDSMTGSDVVNQSEEFGKAVKIDSVVLTKADAYGKGGALLSASYILKKPILFLGTGQNMNDLKEFSKEEIIKEMGF